MLRPLLDTVFAARELLSWEFDLLATLRRAGRPHQLSAGQLLESMMISSGAVTNRIDRLEARGFVKRTSDSTDGRRVLVALTKSGLATINDAVTDHTANAARLVAQLAPADRAALEAGLRNLHHAIVTATDSVKT